MCASSSARAPCCSQTTEEFFGRCFGQLYFTTILCSQVQASSESCLTASSWTDRTPGRNQSHNTLADFFHHSNRFPSANEGIEAAFFLACCEADKVDCFCRNWLVNISSSFCHASKLLPRSIRQQGHTNNNFSEKRIRSCTKKILIIAFCDKHSAEGWLLKSLITKCFEANRDRSHQPTPG